MNVNIEKKKKVLHIWKFLNPLPTLEHPFSTYPTFPKYPSYGQKTPYLAPNIRNSLAVSLKATEGLINIYKHKIKKHFLNRMKNDESDTNI